MLSSELDVHKVHHTFIDEKVGEEWFGWATRLIRKQLQNEAENNFSEL